MAIQADKTYVLDGTLLEACSCAGPCPCWVGEDPDDRKCDATVAYTITSGQIQGVDVSGLSLVHVTQIPGNISAGNCRLVIYLDNKASPEQRQALLDAFSGKLGGPLADLAALFGEVVKTYSVPIAFQVKEGQGTLRMGDAVELDMTPYTDAQGQPTMLHNATYAGLPVSRAYVGKTSNHQAKIAEHGMNWELSGKNAIQGQFHVESSRSSSG